MIIRMVWVEIRSRIGLPKSLQIDVTQGQGLTINRYSNLGFVHLLDCKMLPISTSVATQHACVTSASSSYNAFYPTWCPPELLKGFSTAARYPSLLYPYQWHVKSSELLTRKTTQTNL